MSPQKKKKKNLLSEFFLCHSLAPHLVQSNCQSANKLHTVFQVLCEDKDDSKRCYYSLNSPDILNSERELPNPVISAAAQKHANEILPSESSENIFPHI